MDFLEEVSEVNCWKQKRKLIIPVLSSPKKHWVLNQLSFIYAYDLDNFEECILTFNHNDAQNLHISVLSDFVGQDNFIYQKKYLNDCGQNYDAQMAFWLETNDKLDVEVPFTIRRYWNQFRNVENINDCIPIMKWLEWCREVKDKFVLNVKKYEPDETLKQYDKLLENLSIIEKNGLFTL